MLGMIIKLKEDGKRYKAVPDSTTSCSTCAMRKQLDVGMQCKLGFAVGNLPCLKPSVVFKELPDTPAGRRGMLVGDHVVISDETAKPMFHVGQTVVLHEDYGDRSPMFVPLPGEYCGFSHARGRKPGAWLLLDSVQRAP